MHNDPLSDEHAPPPGTPAPGDFPSGDGHAPPPGTPAPEEFPPTHFERQDDRWRLRSAGRDWMIVISLIIIYLVWTGVVYFLEPGIR